MDQESGEIPLFTGRIGGPAGFLMGLAICAFILYGIATGDNQTPAYKKAGLWPFGHSYEFMKSCNGSFVWIGPYRVRAVDRADGDAFLKKRYPGCEFRLEIGRRYF